MMKMKFSRSQLLEPPWKKNEPECVTDNQAFAMKKMNEQTYPEIAHSALEKLL